MQELGEGEGGLGGLVSYNGFEVGQIETGRAGGSR